MNKYILISMMLLLLVPLVSAEMSLSTELLKYEPIPAQPGQYITVYLEMQNIGNEDAPAVLLQVEDEFPFKVADSNVRNIGLLKSQQSFVEEFRIKVSSEAPVGNNLLKIKYTGDGDTWYEKDLIINVKPNEASLTITKVETDKIAPGENGRISIGIKNNADIVLRNIALQLNMVTIQGSTITDLPFIPSESATEKQVTKLNPREITTINFDVSAYPSATPGYYKLPITISFFDEEGTETENQDYVGVIIEGKPELKILLEESKIYEGDEQGEITLKFVNKGINDLKFLDISLLDGENYKVLTGSNNYIGDLDSDDYRSESFTIQINKEKNVELNVKATFKDENNQDYEKTITIPLRYGYKNEDGKNNYVGTIIIILIVLVAGIILWRRRSKKRRH